MDLNFISTELEAILKYVMNVDSKSLRAILLAALFTTTFYSSRSLVQCDII